ncbi:hypothetical protein [Macrococcus armenti]|uniref:hypothetical protein n=1 Tax=Macrococcus armenti TaxID=2875764 RepID=UPI001CCD1795|nr:hypothetical protein [Macrococcus armenti]UBH07858.1 hypothetical protein LAU41_07430 [Macrococcus armenti]
MGWLINAGDKFNLDNKNWEVIFIDNDSVAVARSEIGEGRVVSQRTIYKTWYEHQKQRADELENILTHIKSHLNDLWYNGDASEHEYAINTLKYINSLEDNNARSK